MKVFPSWLLVHSQLSEGSCLYRVCHLLRSNTVESLNANNIKSDQEFFEASVLILLETQTPEAKLQIMKNSLQQKFDQWKYSFLYPKTKAEPYSKEKRVDRLAKLPCNFKVSWRISEEVLLA